MEKEYLPDQLAGYEIQVIGRLNEGWLERYEGLSMTFEEGVTTLISSPLDQSALRGLLCWLWDIQMSLLLVRRMNEIWNDK